MSEKVQRVSRVAAANTLVAGIAPGTKTTLGQLAQRVDDEVVKGGGNPKLSAATLAVQHALGMAEALGLMRLTKPTDTIVERIK